MNKDKIDNFPILRVMWRRWIFPFTIALIASIAIKIIFYYLFEGVEDPDFLIGWISCVILYTVREANTV